MPKIEKNTCPTQFLNAIKSIVYCDSIDKWNISRELIDLVQVKFFLLSFSKKKNPKFNDPYRFANWMEIFENSKILFDYKYIEFPLISNSMRYNVWSHSHDSNLTLTNTQFCHIDFDFIFKETMSTNDWMAVMDKIGSTLQRQVTVTLRDIKNCFDREGRSFDGKFKEYFLHLLTNRYWL